MNQMANGAIALCRPACLLHRRGRANRARLSGVALTRTALSKCAVDVHLLLTQPGKVLLSLRQGTGFADGMWNLPSGKVESGENAIEAMLREAKEELDLRLSHGDVKLSSTVQCRNSETDIRIGLFFHMNSTARTLEEARNAEPHKCAEIAWFPVDALPQNILSYSALGLSLHSRGEPFGTIGW